MGAARRASSGADADDPWAPFAEGSRRGASCAAARRERLRARAASRSAGRAPSRATLGRAHAGSASTQQAFGRFFVDLAHDGAGGRARASSRSSPDVASSTNLGGWINRVGVWNMGDRIDWFADDTDTLVRWRESAHGQHIELGIAEGNLVGLLGELGATWSRDGQPLLPIGTLYDPFVNRALEPWSFGIYAGRPVDPRRHAVGRHARARGRRAPVDHHAVGRARAAALRGLGAGLRPGPRVDAAARARRGSARPDGTSAYFRLSTRPIDQALGGGARRPAARERAPPPGARRRLPPARAPTGRPTSTLVGMGAVMPEVLARGATS